MINGQRKRKWNYSLSLFFAYLIVLRIAKFLETRSQVTVYYFGLISNIAQQQQGLYGDMVSLYPKKNDTEVSAIKGNCHSIVKLTESLGGVKSLI